MGRVLSTGYRHTGRPDPVIQLSSQQFPDVRLR